MSPGTTTGGGGDEQPPPISTINVGGKKKFGKNLNKLTAASAAPTTKTNKHAGGRQENGLLLLSAKRGSNLAPTGLGTSGGGGGLLSNNTGSNRNNASKPGNNPKPVLSLHTESNPSTHDALLGVVVGASRQHIDPNANSSTNTNTSVDKMKGSSNQQHSTQQQSQQHQQKQRQPDAWRVSEFKQHDLEKQELLERQQKEEAEDLHRKQTELDRQQRQQQEQQSYHNNDRRGFSTEEGEIEEQQHFKTSNWDEYGGRDVPSSPSRDEHRDHTSESQNDDGSRNIRNSDSEATSGNSQNKQENPNSYMTKKAHERAAKRRQEEEERMAAQKERAAERLRLLDEKAGRTAQSGSGRNINGQNRDEISTPLNSRSMALDRNHNNETPTDRMERNNRSRQRGNNTRTLFDPNAPSSSSTNRNQNSNGQSQSHTHNRSPRLNGMDGPSTTKRNGNHRPRLGSEADRSSGGDTEEKQDMIHLSSYEDQDRGTRGGANAGPRMLFDPKSGSMVEAGSTAGPPTTKSSRRAARTRTGRNNQRTDALWDAGGGRGNGAKNARGGRRDPKLDRKKKEFPEPRKSPRTCGVLYGRDAGGNYYCVDGEDQADLGYGAHAVPGGRANNPDGIAVFEEDEKQESTAPKKNVSKKKDQKKRNANRKKNRKLTRNNKGDNGKETHPENENDTAGLDNDDYIEEEQPKHEWVKPDDKLELITGVESPTLQATAKEFSPTTFQLPPKTKKEDSPSKRKNNKNAGKPNPSKKKTTATNNDDDEAELGLGFDPTLNMDSVMQSPAMEATTSPADGLGSVDLASLTLEPALKGPAKTSHIFAFESGSTWGAGNHGGSNGSEWGANTGGGSGSSNWNLPTTTAGSNSGTTATLPASFLSLPPAGGSTWGGFGAPQTKPSGD